jgi:hypothetical protein
MRPAAWANAKPLSIYQIHGVKNDTRFDIDYPLAAVRLADISDLSQI